jgi:hypothetical protein
MKNITNMVFTVYRNALIRKFSFYGLLETPLTGAEILACFNSGLSLEDAYSVGCDVNSGLPFDLEPYIGE